MIFLANYVQSDDFCFFSSRKRRKNICFSLSFHKAHYVCASFHQGKEENKILPLLFLCLFIKHTTCVLPFIKEKKRIIYCLCSFFAFSWITLCVSFHQGKEGIIFALSLFFLSLSPPTFTADQGPASGLDSGYYLVENRPARIFDRRGWERQPPGGIKKPSPLLNY